MCLTVSKPSVKASLSLCHIMLIAWTDSAHHQQGSQYWPEGLFQCSGVLGSSPGVMMSAHCIEVTNSIIHRHASFWINILTARFGVYSSASAKTICCAGLDHKYLDFPVLAEVLTI